MVASPSLLLALFAEMERTSTVERAAHARAVAEAAGRCVGWPVAHPAGMVECVWLLQDLDQIATKTAIPKTSCTDTSPMSTDSLPGWPSISPRPTSPASSAVDDPWRAFHG